MSAPPLEDLKAALAGLNRAYETILPSPLVWSTLLQRVPTAEGGLRKLQYDPASPPTLESPTPHDDMKVAAHLRAAEEKSRLPARLAIVGAFSTGKSTLLNAILHCPKFDDLLRKHLGFKEKLLHTGEQPTTGNVTELRFTGARLDGASKEQIANVFQFHVTYLSEIEVKDLIRYFADNERLNLKVEGMLAGSDWVEKLQQYLPVQLKSRYDSFVGEQQDTNVKKNLIALGRLLDALKREDVRRRLGTTDSLDVPDPTTTGGRDLPKTMARFRMLQSQVTIDPPARWADLIPLEKPEQFEFFLVKSVRFEFPHPDFIDLSFSLFDFPGLAAGPYRDEFISRQFIPESNVILVTTREGAVGGEAVSSILDIFTKKRANLSAEALLERIFFVRVDHPKKSPTDKNERLDFFKTYLMMVRQLMHPIMLKRVGEETGKNQDEEYKRLYGRYLSHFIGCDALVGGYYRAEETTGEAGDRRGLYQKCQDRACFQTPTDLATLLELVSADVLQDEKHSFPLLARLLSEPAIAQAIHKMYAGYEREAGITALIERIKQFVVEDSARVTAEDVHTHLIQAAAPLRPFRGFQAGEAGPTGVSVETLQAEQVFTEQAGFEDKWHQVLELWTRQARVDPTRDSDKLPLVRELEDAQLLVEQQVRTQVGLVVNQDTHEQFLRQYKPLPGPLADWIRQLSDQRATGRPTVGGGARPVVGGGAPSVAARLRLDHTLVLYRYYLESRTKLLEFFHRVLFKSFYEAVGKVYLDAGGRDWQPFNELWQRAVELSERTPSRGQPVAELVEYAGNEVTGFLRDAATFTTSPDWFPARLADYYLPVGGAATGDGQFYAAESLWGGHRLQINAWPTPGNMPRTGKQLSAWLARMRVFSLDDVQIQARQAPPLPDLDEKGLRQVLIGVGLIGSEEDLVLASPDDDFWTNPLPRLTGRLSVTDRVMWNPVPFDPFAGPYRAAYGTSVALGWLQQIQDYLAYLFSDLVVKFLRLWKTEYRDMWQQVLNDRLAGIQRNQSFWRWVDDNRPELLKITPLAGKLLELEQILHRCLSTRLI